jgi:hypothetical protein
MLLWFTALRLNNRHFRSLRLNNRQSRRNRKRRPMTSHSAHSDHAAELRQFILRSRIVRRQLSSLLPRRRSFAKAARVLERIAQVEIRPRTVRAIPQRMMVFLNGIFVALRPGEYDSPIRRR